MVRSVSWDYIAGFFDGEGHIGLVERKKHKSTSYQLTFMICNTDKKVLKSIRSKIGGRWVKSINISPYIGRPFLYRIIVQKQETMKHILNKLIPLLIVKKKQAELVLEYINIRLKKREKWIPNGIGFHPPYSKEEKNIYKKLFNIAARSYRKSWRTKK